jgi:hypothetical protein
VGGVWQDDWARCERDEPRRPFQPLFVLPVLFYTGDDPRSGPPELIESCGVPADLWPYAPRLPLAFLDVKRLPAERLAELGPFGSVLAVLQVERAPAVLFGDRLRDAIHTIEQLPEARRALGRRWLWYLYALLHHRRPPAEHEKWRATVQASIERQDLREEVRLMAQTIAESLYDQGLERGMELGMEKGMEKGIEKGMEKGIEKGMEKGIEKGTRDLLLALVQSKFGAASKDVAAWLSAAGDAADLDRFSQRLLRAESVEELRDFTKPVARRHRRAPRSR